MALDEYQKPNQNIKISNFAPLNKKEISEESTSEVKRSFEAVQGFFISASKQNSSVKSPVKKKEFKSSFKPVVKKVPYFKVGTNVKHSFNNSSFNSPSHSKDTLEHANTVV